MYPNINIHENRYTYIYIIYLFEYLKKDIAFEKNIYRCMEKTNKKLSNIIYHCCFLNIHPIGYLIKQKTVRSKSIK